MAREAFGGYLRVVRQALLDAASAGAARGAGLRPLPTAGATNPNPDLAEPGQTTGGQPQRGLPP